MANLKNQSFKNTSLIDGVVRTNNEVAFRKFTSIQSLSAEVPYVSISKEIVSVVKREFAVIRKNNKRV